MAITKRQGARGVAYRVIVDYPADALTGKRKQRSETFRTKKEADAREREWLTEIERGTASDDTKLTVAELFAAWLDVLRGTNPKARTVMEYERTIHAHIIPALGTMLVRKVTPAAIDALYATLRAEGASDDKVHRVHKRLSQVFSYALKRRIIAVNPMLAIDPPTVRSKPPIILTGPQIKRFLTFASADTYDPLWLVLVQTGMRRGEVLGLRWRDIDFTHGRVQVRQAVELIGGNTNITTPKTKAALRTITLFPESVAALRVHKARQHEMRLRAGETWRDVDLVFTTSTGGPMNARNVLHALKNIQRAANGLEKWHRDKPKGALSRRQQVAPEDLLPDFDIHDLRHTHATHLLQEGWPIPTVSRRLGHANPAITLSIYAHALADTPEPHPVTPAAFAFAAIG